MLYHLPTNFLGGNLFFKLTDRRHVTPDDYYRVLEQVRPLLARGDFSAATPGFYINYIRDENTPTGGLRLNYFTTNASQTIDAIDAFIAASASLEILRTEHADRTTPLSEYRDGESETEFKNFLDANTRVCLDMVENFGEHSFESLVAAYRFVFLPQQVPAATVFEDYFARHSSAFNELKQNGLDARYWDDLVRTYPDRGVGLHFMVNFVTLIDDFRYAGGLRLTPELAKQLHRALGQLLVAREDGRGQLDVDHAER